MASAAVTSTTSTAGTASVRTTTATIDRKGRGRFRLTCSAAGPCAGTYAMGTTRAVLARGRYTVPAGRTANVTFKLTAKGKKLLRKHHGRLRTRLRLTPSGQAATARALTLKQPTRRT